MDYLIHASLAQDELGRGQSVNGIALPDGSGLVAASSPLDTGFGFLILPMRHVATTSWALLAAQHANPLQG